MKRSYYQGSFEAFVQTSIEALLGRLVAEHGHDVDLAQRNAWILELRSLRELLPDLGSGHILLEVAVPRMGKRADVVLLWSGVVVVLEYKVGADQFERAALDQVMDYALDLKNFHAASHSLPIAPVLVATAAAGRAGALNWGRDGIAMAQAAGLPTLQALLFEMRNPPRFPDIDIEGWLKADYRPTPTIVEAATALYGGHEVEEITRSEAGVENLRATAAAIQGLIARAKAERRKAICFVTGVPGSGKTLAGLNLATESMRSLTRELAVFLSGNGPLVEVLTQALSRDEACRGGTRKDAALRKARTFIQNVHHFRDEGLRSDRPPAERIVIFDEAQRAWDRDQTTRFMRQKRGHETFDASEPEFLLSVMDRHEDWCVVVCLVGGGQEINTGEAGLSEWFQAVGRNCATWMVALPAEPGQLSQGPYVDLPSATTVIQEPALHLGVSIRSFRAELISNFVEAILSGSAESARELGEGMLRYPLKITRSLGLAKEWLRSTARGTERYGLVASSNALRLKPEGLHVKAGIQVAEWFLQPKEDVRSSYVLEDVASEFEVQGLELDWVGVCWDANLRMSKGGWGHFRFRGTRWERIQDKFKTRYLVNSYRVLLTRARQGLVVYVPEGDRRDPTRDPDFYDGTYNFLLECGFSPI